MINNSNSRIKNKPNKNKYNKNMNNMVFYLNHYLFLNLIKILKTKNNYVI